MSERYKGLQTEHASPCGFLVSQSCFTGHYRGYAVAGGGALLLDTDLAFSGPVNAASGNFAKGGPGKLTYAALGTNFLARGGGAKAYAIGAGSVVLNDGASTPTNLVPVITGNTLDISWPGNYTGWRLEAQTNFWRGRFQQEAPPQRFSCGGSGKPVRTSSRGCLKTQIPMWC